jgi:glucose-1-phosphate thymidylyltransferase
MKGIVLAGGAGTRLKPVTLATSKQLLPVYDKPLVYYPLSVLMLAKIRDILIITTPADRPAFERLLGDGGRLGVRFTYAVQVAPKGIAEAFIVGAQYLAGSPATLILGDNIFFGNGLSALMAEAIARERGASVFAYHVDDPQRYGVVKFDERDRPVAIEEKPPRPLSNWAITGLYVYDSRVVDIAHTLSPSARGELEITDLNRAYLEAGDLHAVRMGRGYAWLDAGTHDSLLEAGNFIRAIEVRQGVKIGCLEEIALHNGWLKAADIERIIAGLKSSTYARYLELVVREFGAALTAAAGAASTAPR